MRISRDCWQCEFDDCRHIWIATTDVAPAQCARCKKRGWHTEGAVALSDAKPSPAPRRLKTDAAATTGGKVTIATVEPQSNRVLDVLLNIPQVAPASDPRYIRPAHDPKECRNKFCGLCAAAKGGK
jgi:hypothetical protein